MKPGYTCGMIFSLLLGIVIGAAALLFALQNMESVSLSFIEATSKVRLS